jgi:hypothetical protein
MSGTDAAWLRRPDESDSAFRAFACYRDLGARRSLRAVAQELGKSGSLISRWSAEHEWRSRVRAWDAEQDRVKREAQRAEADELGRRHARTLRTQIEALAAPAVALLSRLSHEPEAFADLAPAELLDLVAKTARPLSQLIELERATRGVSDDGDDPCCEHERSRREVAAMSREERQALLVGIDTGPPLGFRGRSV